MSECIGAVRQGCVQLSLDVCDSQASAQASLDVRLALAQPDQLSLECLERRLIRLLVEGALGFLPFQDRTVETPTGQLYVGVETDTKLCAVSLIRCRDRPLRVTVTGPSVGARQLPVPLVRPGPERRWSRR